MGKPLVNTSLTTKTKPTQISSPATSNFNNISEEKCIDYFLTILDKYLQSFVLPPQRVSKWWSHEVGGAKFADCFVSAISTSNPIVFEGSSFSIAILLSLASRMACSSYLITLYQKSNCARARVWRGGVHAIEAIFVITKVC